MNKSRELFLLFPYIGNIPTDYTVIYKHTFPNDEPPYINVTYFGLGIYQNKVYIEDGEFVTQYLIRTKDAERFINLMNSYQNEYCDYYVEGVYTRNAGEHNLKPDVYAKGAVRRPKIKYLSTQPIMN